MQRGHTEQMAINAFLFPCLFLSLCLYLLYSRCGLPNCPRGSGREGVSPQVGLIVVEEGMNGRERNMRMRNSRELREKKEEFNWQRKEKLWKNAMNHWEGSGGRRRK